MRLRFVVPGGVEAPTGGNVYDLAAAAAMRRGGHVVEMLRVEATDLADALKQPWTGATLVDGLLISHQPEIVESSPLGVLLHMPLGWQPGLSSEEVAEAEALEGRALRAALVVISTSAWTAKFLQRRYHLPDVAVAAPGVDAAPLVGGSDPPRLVQVAAVLPHKNQLIVVEALARLKDLPWQACLAGSTTRDPDYAAAVQTAVAAHAMTGRVEIAGEIDRELAWAGADLALLPSRVESFGMVVTEGLARGIPAIVAAGGPAEALGCDLLGNAPGVVVAPDDVDVLVHELRRWLTDVSHRDALRASALARRETLDGWEVTARCLSDALSAHC